MKIKSNYPPEFWLANEYLQEIGKFPLSVTDLFGSDCIGDAPRKGWCYDAKVWTDSMLAPLYFPSFTVRDKLVRKYSWAIPTEAILKTVAKYSPLVEIGAGTGYWAYLLAKLGADIICYDTHVENTPPETIWYAIGAGNESKVMEHSNRALFLCWPPYSQPMASNCLKAYTGDTLVYIGEGYSGCTGDGEFHDILEKDWTEVEQISLLNWFGIHDSLWVYHRNN